MPPPDAQHPPAGGPGGEQNTDDHGHDIGSTEDSPPVDPEAVCCDAHAARAYRSEATIPVGHQWLRWGLDHRPQYLKHPPGRPMPRPKLAEVAS